jgi:hypothetical protein
MVERRTSDEEYGQGNAGGSIMTVTKRMVPNFLQEAGKIALSYILGQNVVVMEQRQLYFGGVPPRCWFDREPDQLAKATRARVKWASERGTIRGQPFWRGTDWADRGPNASLKTSGFASHAY